uniref:G-protein coupled receptors family 3 profile domain-containing protein n=1 Tax=Eptatretus burgeri TaxID=7764 RepID=A0A8C4WT13_EPTBU
MKPSTKFSLRNSLGVPFRHLVSRTELILMSIRWSSLYYPQSLIFVEWWGVWAQGADSLGPSHFGCINIFRSVLAMIYAVDEINRNSSILPNTSLGYMIYDSCFNMQKTLTVALSYLGQKFSKDLREDCPIHAVVGESGSQHSLTIARFFALFLIPQISYFASCQCLSDKQQFPSFLRTMPSDTFQSIAIARTVRHFGWLYIATIENNEDYGREGIAQFIAESEEYGLCFAFQEVLPKKDEVDEIKRLGDEIADTKAKVILAFTSVTDFMPIISEMLQRNITKKQWIASENWIDSSVITAQDTINMFQGTIGFALIRGFIPGFHDFLINLQPTSVNIFLLEFWEQTFHCTWNPNDETSQLCTGSENLGTADTSLTDVSNLRVSYNSYTAVYAIAKALHNLQYCVQMKGISANITCGDILSFEPWELLFYLRNVEFINNLGDLVKFDKNGDPSGNSYELINWQLDENGQIQFNIVGDFKSSAPPEKQLHLTNKSILWNDGTHKESSSSSDQKGEPFCCFDCIPCGDGTYSNTTDSPNCYSCPEMFWSTKENNGCVRMPIEFLDFSDPLSVILLTCTAVGLVFTILIGVMMYLLHELRMGVGLLLLALTSCFVCTIIFVGEPTDATCPLRQTLAFTSLVFVISCVISRTYEMLLQTKGKFLHLNPRLLVLLGVSPQLLLCISWALWNPSTSMKNTSANPGIVILECRDSSPVWPISAFSYLGLLILICLCFSVKISEISPSFSEIRFVTFSMLVCSLICLAFVPAYASTQGKYSTASEIFALLGTAFGILSCIFVPKCYAAFKLRKSNN